MEDVAGLKPSELARIRGRLEGFAVDVFEPLERSYPRRLTAPKDMRDAPGTQPTSAHHSSPATASRRANSP